MDIKTRTGNHIACNMYVLHLIRLNINMFNFLTFTFKLAHSNISFSTSTLKKEKF